MARILAILSLVTTAFFVVAVLALHLLRPDINPMVSGISFYALGAYGFLLGLALVLVGLSGIALAIALWHAATSTGHRIGLLLLIAWGVSSILAGIFPLDAPGEPPTLSGTIHNISGLNFLLIAPAFLLIELRTNGAKTAIHSRTVTYWLAWLLLVSAILLFTFNGPLSSLQVGGVFQRFYWIVLVFWFVYKAVEVWRRERNRTHDLHHMAV